MRGWWRRWWRLLASVLCLLLGAGLLLAFMQHYTVPHVVTSMFQATTCHVRALCPPPGHVITTWSPHVNTSLLSSGGSPSPSACERLLNSQHTNSSSPSSSSSHPPNHHPQTHSSSSDKNERSNSQNISYSVNRPHSDKHPMVETKYHMDRDQQTSDVVETSSIVLPLTSNLLCPLVLVSSALFPDEVVVLVQDSWMFYTRDPSHSKCGCPDCFTTSTPASFPHHLLYTLRLPPGSGDVNGTLPCLVNPQNGSELIWTRSSNLVIMNVMFWPTLLVIVGFVSLFFSWLFLQYDNYKGDCCCV